MNTKSEPVLNWQCDPGPGYRLLNPGEEIESGDEFFSSVCGAWVKAGCVGVKYSPGRHLAHRRNLVTPRNDHATEAIEKLREELRIANERAASWEEASNRADKELARVDKELARVRSLAKQIVG
jgi:hypothetical protein